MADSFLEIRELRKTFHTKERDIEVLKGINLSVNKGEIYGIVGFSGAGKSTLVRCINRLEEPDSGSVILDGKDITGLNKKELNLERSKIGMIFQQFNLFDSMTVAENIAYPLKVNKWKKEDIDARIDELLELVYLSEKKNAYPGELSGGQKQRVGIARALAGNPSVLLSDEATSALDPITTLSVLDLIKEINQKLGITILLITHQLEVVKYACDRVAVMENGEFKEVGSVNEVFLDPQSETGKKFINVFNQFRNKEQEGE